jgi:signal transduction histidine kinase
MTRKKHDRRTWMAWLFIGALLVLCGVLGILQYRWIGEVSVALRDRLRGNLQANLVRLSQDFNSEVVTAARSLLPATSAEDTRTLRPEIETRFAQWKKTAREGQPFRRIGLVEPAGDQVSLSLLNPESGAFEASPWPDDWLSMRRRMEARLNPGPEPLNRQFQPDDQGLTLEVPLFTAQRGRPQPPFGRRELGWMIFDLNLAYLREVVLPDVVQRHLEPAGTLDYQVEVVTRSHPPGLIYQSDPNAGRIGATADASVGLFEIRLGQFPDGGGRGGRGGRGGPGPGGPGFGRWEMLVRHRAGSLDAVVAQTRRKNLAVTGCVLLLLLATLGALVRFTRNAQRLARLQMDFVAGVSHELRTPLTAIYTAGHNLRGRVAHNPAQVERYGEMIQKESGRLKDLVEQVLRFASANAGRVIHEPSPVSVESVIDQSVESSRSVLQAANCTVETHIDPALPLVMGDPLALKHALQNLLSNAVKYGPKDHGWIGISASGMNGDGRPGVEIRVADHGPGIPEDEQQHIFDPFFRGRRALQDQIHGAGLGLNLVKKIVEAHGGSIRVRSGTAEGAEFIVRLPAAPQGVAQ